MRAISGQYRGWVLLFIGVLILAEIAWSWRRDKKVYQLKDTFANIGVLIGFHLSKLLFTGYQLAVLGGASSLALFHLPRNGWVFALTFITADFLYYWFHRASHVWKPLWAFHLVHHSSPLMNLTAAYRLNWFSALVSPAFFVPAALLGLPPEFIVLSYALNLLYQFFMHTEVVDKLGPVEGILDTPSAHRVHHGSNPLYIDKNFGGVLMVWDRLFHTYQPETEPVRYGLTTGFISNNPFVLVMHGFIQLFYHTKHTIMKKAQVLNRSTAVIAAAMLLLTSCKKDSSDAGVVTEDDAADAVTQAVVASSGGVTAQTSEVARISTTYASACGVSKDSSVAYASTPGAAITYSFAASWHWMLTCGTASHFDFTYSGNLIYDAPRMSSNDKVTATVAVTGLSANSAAYILNVAVTRNGSQVSKIRNKNTFTSVLTLTGTDIAVNKQTLLVDSGTLAVTFTGSGTGGRSFSHSGTLSFKGNKTAVLTLKSGAVYSIAW
jgi:sterol desaturase/sphingolipid hydroxylase (fatty acid hydroxylase superfamily)